MKTYVFEPIHVLNALLLVINCVFIVMLVSACSAKVTGPSYASLAPVGAPATPASSPSAPEPTLTGSEGMSAADFIAAMLAP
jgi:hypothetical protein